MSFPSIAYRIRDKGKEFVIKQPQDFPDKPKELMHMLLRVAADDFARVEQIAGIEGPL